MIYLLWFILIAFLFDKALYCGYCVDDTGMKRSMDPVRKNKFPGYTPLTFLTKAMYGAGVFPSAFWEHLFTLIIHFINTCLLYNISQSVLITSLWMLNPVNNQTTLWLNGRRYQMSLLWCLIAWKFKFLFIPAFILAIMTHHSAVALPLMFLSIQQYIYLVPFAYCCLGMFGFKRIKRKFLARKKDFIETSELHRITPKKISIIIKGLGFYFFHTILPLKPAMYHEFLYYFSRYEKDIKKGYSIWTIDFLKGIIALTFIGYELFFQGNFWAFWWIAFQLQWSPAYPVTMMVSDRYTTISSIGLMHESF